MATDSKSVSREINASWLIAILQDLNPAVKNKDPRENLFDSGFLDSLSMIELVNRFEISLRIGFDYSDFSPDNFKDVTSILKMLVTRYDCELNETVSSAAKE